MTIDDTFQTLFAVPLSCDGCVRSVSDALYNLSGITKVEANLRDQLIAVEGSAAPSKIAEAIQATGRDAILRGSGSSDSAAVCILESFAEPPVRTGLPLREVRGLARMVQVGPGRTLVDLTIRGVSPGVYQATIREYGDVKKGVASTGPVLRGHGGPGRSSPDKAANGVLGSMHVGPDGGGSVFADHGFCIWEIIGHAMAVTRQAKDQETLQNDADTVVGVIARSSGTWDNDKTVCSCTGKTLWEERKDQVAKGML